MYLQTGEKHQSIHSFASSSYSGESKTKGKKLCGALILLVVASVQCNIKGEKSVTRASKTFKKKKKRVKHKPATSQKVYGEEEVATFTEGSRAVL